MQIQLRFYSLLKNDIGSEKITIKLPLKSTLLELKKKLSEDFPLLRERIPTFSYNSNRIPLENDSQILDGSEISIFPPVVGG